MKHRYLALGCLAIVLCGCTALDLRSKSKKPDKPDPAENSSRRYVGDLTVPFGMQPLVVENVAVVSGLHGTGSDPEPSPQRSVVIDEMQRRGVENPNAVLASKNMSLVLVRGVMRPGIQKGDHFDVEIRIPDHSETTSLRGGYLLETRLSEQAVLDDQVHPGRLRGTAQGPVLVDPLAKGKEDRVLLGRGRVLGAGVSLITRQLGLVLKPGKQSVVNSARIAAAVDKRFHTTDKGIQIGVAKAKTDEYVELRVHPRYKDNLDRYLQVVRSVVLQESPTELMARLKELENRLLEPSTASQAAIELEAIGVRGVDVLLKGVRGADPEVRFYAAEALAYLDNREAAEPLAEAARNEPAFRVYALAALSAMDDSSAYDQLTKLLDLPSAETRYGAFRALWAMNPRDALVRGELLGGQFSYNVIDTTGPPMIHVTWNRRAEVVVFGRQQRLVTPLSINAGTEILVTSEGGDQVSVAKFSPHEADQKRSVSTRVDDVVRAIVELGGTYPDVVQALQEAKATGALTGRFAVETIPEAGRIYERQPPADDEKAKPDAGKAKHASKPSDKGDSSHSAEESPKKA